MNILHLTPSYFPAHRHGGPIVSVHTLNKWLVKLGMEVTVYTTNINAGGLLEGISLNKETLVDGVKVVYFPLTWRAWEYSREMHCMLKKNARNFDLIHITSVFLSASALGARYAKKFRVPYVISPRGSLMKEPLMMKSAFLKRAYLALIEKRNLAGAAAVHFTVSKEEEEYREARLPIKKGIVIPNASELSEEARSANRAAFRERYRIERSAKVVLAMGRINWKKGFDTLIPSFAKVAEKVPGAILLVAGNDEVGYKKTVEELITNNQLQDRVIFTGLLSGIEKWNAFAASDVFVLPSYSENFGMAVVEAMAMGVPVVVSDKVGLAPDIASSEAGIVTKKDEEEVASGILNIITNEASAKKMGENGRRLTQEKFSPEKVTQELISAYNELVQLWRQSSTSSFSPGTKR